MFFFRKSNIDGTCFPESTRTMFILSYPKKSPINTQHWFATTWRQYLLKTCACSECFELDNPKKTHSDVRTKSPSLEPAPRRLGRTSNRGPRSARHGGGNCGDRHATRCGYKVDVRRGRFRQLIKRAARRIRSCGKEASKTLWEA